MVVPIDQTDKGFVEHWRRVGPELERIRQEELRRYDHDENWAIIDALLQIGYERGEARPTSGLVELERLLAKAQR